MERMKWLLLVIPAALLVVLGYSIGAGRADARAAEANQRAAVAAATASAEAARADSALALHEVSQRVVDSLRTRGVQVVTRYREVRNDIPEVPAVVPDTCSPLLEIIEQQQEALHLADFAIRTHEEVIDSLGRDNARLAGALDAAKSELLVASRELTKQAGRTERVPRKLLGIVPMPEISLGYGAQYRDGQVRTGPQVNVGWRIKL